MKQQDHALLICSNLSFDYDGVTILRNISFTVEDGDYLCILGENGAGKSTLIKGLLGLKSPCGGTVAIGGGVSRAQIGYMPQQTRIQRDFPASVMEVVLSGCLNALGFRPFYGAAEKKRAARNMELLGLTDLQRRCYRDLSGGQQQRVLLARALCAADRLLLLDEPAAGLDPLVTNELYQLIHRINTELGITIIMVSHDIRAALKYARHVLHIRPEQYFFGSIDEYRQSPFGQLFLENGEK